MHPLECSIETISSNVVNGSVTRKPNREVGHLCYMRPLKDVLPANTDKVLCVFYDFETTKNMRNADKAKAHVPNLLVSKRFVRGE